MSEGGWCELLSCTLLSVECVLYNRGVLRSLDSPCIPGDSTGSAGRGFAA